MYLTQIEETLRQDLSHQLVRVYPVTSFCKKTNISRGQFYHRFDSMAEVFAIYIESRIKRVLRDSNYTTFGSRILAMINEAKIDQIIYRNIFMLMKDQCICERLKKTFIDCIEAYAKRRGPYAVTAVKRAGVGIYTVMYHWLAHEFEDEPLQLYQNLFFYIRLIEEQCKRDNAIEWPM